MAGALFCPIYQRFPIWFHYVPTLLLFPFNNLKIVIQTHYITFQDINLQPYFEIACVKSVLCPVLNSNVDDVSLSGGSLGYWTACNNFKRHCTLPYCVHIGVIIFPNIDNTQSTDLDQFEANEYEYQKLEVPINLACHLRRQLYISL